MPIQGFTDARRAERLLRQAADVVVELGLDGRLVFISDAVESILGRPARSFLGLSFLEIVVPEDRTSTLAAFQKVVETGAELIVRFHVLRRDGLRVAFEASLRGFEEAGERSVIAVCRDITQQSAEGAVDRERNAHYRAIVESGSRLAAIVSASGEIHFSSHRFKQTFGQHATLADITAQASTESQSTLANSWFVSTQPDGAPSGSGDFEYSDPDGSRCWYSLRWDGYRSESGERLFAIVFQDITQRKRIEQALRTIATGVLIDGSETLRQTVEMVAQTLDMDRFLIATIDADQPEELVVVAALENGRHLELARLPSEDLPEATVMQGEACIHPSGLGQLMPAVAHRMERAFESYAGVPMRRADGTVLGVLGGYGLRPILDTDLTRSLLSAFATHAAAAIDRARAEADVRANRDRFDALVLQSNDLLLEVDEAGTVTYASEALLPILGYASSEMVGRLLEDFTHPDDLEIAQSSRARLRAGEPHTLVTARSRHKDQSWRWLESKTIPFTASDGAPRALLICRDVTERRRDELGRDLLYRVVQEGTDLVFVCQPDARLVFANGAATRRLGELDLTPVEGRPFFEFLVESDAKRLRQEILPKLGPAVPWTGELMLRGNADEPSVATEATIFLFRGGSGSSRSHLAVSLRDISARRSVQAALRESEIRLGQAQKMEAVGRLAGGVAHDFNNLLTAIIGYGDMLIDELGEDHAARRDAEEILRAAERAGGLTRQLLAFSRRQVLQPESIDLNAVVADIDRMLRRLIGENIELVTLQDGEIRPIIADPGQIEQVIVNLVVNARDAMPQGGRLELETANVDLGRPIQLDSGMLEPGPYVTLRVRDSGAGMDAETRRQIFEPFFTTKEVHHGTGLGLASVYGIVSQSGGRIGVESAPGQGSTFTIYMPAAQQSQNRPQRDRSQVLARGDETILLLEDSETVRRLVQRTLERNGYKVLVAESAVAALRHCSRHQGAIELLLTDVVLPKMPGPAVAARAQELRPGIRVLFMSGFSDDTLVRHGLSNEEVDLIEKPFTPASLLGRIRSLLDAEPARDALDASFPVEQP